ncbi:FmdB family zinc ribbon protein [Acidaminobacter hydrogenoformans]|uniref:Putative regulatory protein, FmdB family n=1 Tax=Acidaminobacter hydrogenoformans DSM 2784 TaxID=1120920 RepID=A0A1G5S611_9FIRM|nr:zinc ribbon domain-containing protein [Acidaminobacter hydrogenoformans]SCZ81330.1 putative regulatory protein, FmdB family [Acidaminobacter hydrogenoformans DSM 2784]
MPSYDLLCSDCGHKFSVFCSISAKDQQRCPSCDSPNIKTRFTAVNVSGTGSKSGSNSSSSFSAPRTTGFG